MSYIKICTNCGIKSDQELEFCPECGTEKQIKFSDNTVYSSVVKYFANKVPKIDGGERIISLLLNLLIILFGLLLITPLIESSQLLWIIFLLIGIQGILKEISNRYSIFKHIHRTSKILIFIYLGAGSGNFVSYAGRNFMYNLSDYFSIEMLYQELFSGNGLVVIGAISGIVILVFIKFLKISLKQ